jgi:hypothetical protein
MSEIKLNINDYSKKFEEFFNNRNLSDFIIYLQKDKSSLLYCHKFILDCCQHFKNLFMKERNIKEYILDPDIDDKYFTDYIYYLYTGKINQKTNYLAIVVLSEYVKYKIILVWRKVLQCGNKSKEIFFRFN